MYFYLAILFLQVNKYSIDLGIEINTDYILYDLCSYTIDETTINISFIFISLTLQKEYW